jgi:hypothetical protein
MSKGDGIAGTSSRSALTSGYSPKQEYRSDTNRQIFTTSMHRTETSAKAMGCASARDELICLLQGRERIAADVNEGAYSCSLELPQ